MNFSDLSQFDYVLPPALIRKRPLEPRDSARLFVYDVGRDEIRMDVFRNLSHYLPKRSLVVLNNTRVLPARLFLKKETGGKIEVLVLANEIRDGERIPAIVDRKVVPGQRLFYPDGSSFEVLEQRENVFFLRLASEKPLSELLEQYGTTPVPHYLEGEGDPEEGELRRRYQTVFARAGASVAAPTASLHFTEAVFASLEAQGIGRTEITLNVGLGTFAPLSEENFKTRKLHTEYVEVSPQSAEVINAAKKDRRPVVAVGTTVARTLEGLAQEGRVVPYRGPLNTFLYPPYSFQMADILLTNFHLPKTSLMLLVEAFLSSQGSRRGVRELYEEAIRQGMSFYSFGDSMLILPSGRVKTSQ